MTNIRRALEAAAGTGGGGEADPESTDFDGQTNYLERTTQFSNVSDSNTFTLSFWIWPSPMWATATDGGLNQAFYWEGTATTTTRNQYKYLASSTVSGKVLIGLQDTGGNWFALYIQVPTSTWTHVLLSVNLSSSSTRYVYLNDIDVSTNTDIVDWDTYSDINIDFTCAYSRFGKLHSAQQWFQGRLSNFFLDMTYRDLSSSVNRRHFIDADGFPADPSGLSPPIYFPMTDATTVGTNSGTGGNMTEYGTFAQSVRGPNQVNCISSDLAAGDSVLDANWDSAGSSVVTGSFICSANARTGETQFIHQPSGGYWDCKIDTSGTRLNLNFLKNSSPYTAAQMVIPVSNLATYHVAFSFNTGSEAASKVFINGVDVTATATSTTFNSGTIYFSGWPKFQVSNTGNVGTIGEVWFEKVYRDLASDNIFWDSDNNRPYTVAQVMENNSITPLQAMPMYPPDPAQNDGSEVDVPTIYSLPWRGALSMSEYQGRTIYNDTSTSRPIQRYGSALSGVSDGKTWSMAFSGIKNASASNFVFAIGPQYSERVSIMVSGSSIQVKGRDSSGTSVLYLEHNMTFVSTDTQWYNFLICVDTADSSNCKLYVNGIVKAWTVTTIVNSNINLSNSTGTTLYAQIESSTLSQAPWRGSVGNLFWTTEYIDFGVEANRRKFYSPLQLPVDCGSDGTTPTGTAPAVYMRNDINAYGTNAGTGGNFDTDGSSDIIEGRLIGYNPLT